MRQRTHPSGSNHWTRQPGVERAPWAKLDPKQITALCADYAAGISPTVLARDYRIGRATVYRYLRTAGLIG